MKQMKKQLIVWLAAIALITTSCVEDDYAEDSRTPIQFTVSMTGNKATTRSAVDDIWNGGEAVAVQMTSGGSSIVKKYKIDNSESPVKLVPYDSSVQPFYWPHSGSTEVTVSAWYPYAETKQTVATTNTDIKDQSTEENYEAANLMEAADVTHTYNVESPTTPLELTFSHRMAKLIIRPYYYKNKDGNQSRLIKADVEKTTAYAINVCKNPSNDNNIPITAYKNLADEDDCKFEVLVAPQSIPADTKFIRLSYANSESHNSQTFEFSTTAQALEAGKTYIFNVNFNTAADSAFVVTYTNDPTYSFTYEPNTMRYFLGDGTEEDFASKVIVECKEKTLIFGTDYEIDSEGSTLSATNAGTYDVIIKGMGEYKGTNTKEIEWTINKKDGTLTPPDAKTGLVANGDNAMELIIPGSFKDNGTDIGHVYYMIANSKPASNHSGWSTSIPTGNHAGTYKVWYKAIADINTNYNDIDVSASAVEVTIKPN